MPSTIPTWITIDPALSRAAADARGQLHHALQFGTAFGISYLPRAADDSHTNLGWSRELDALVSRPTAGEDTAQLALRVADLTVMFLERQAAVAELPLQGLTIRDAHARIASQLGTLGLDQGRYTLARHFEIPPHPVGQGAPFDFGDGSLTTLLAEVLANANAALHVVAEAYGGSEVRLWPHHADIATLIKVAPGRTTGAGLALGDAYYPEPYFYVNAYPTPPIDRLPRDLAGGGTWHTHEWVGAVLPLTRLDPDGTQQSVHVQAFLASALDATTTLLRT